MPETTKTFGVDFNFIRFEYTTKEGKFDVEPYNKALENFHALIDETLILPEEDFLIIGVEHFHLLDKHQTIFKELCKKVLEIEKRLDFEEFTDFMDLFPDWAQKYQEKIDKRHIMGKNNT